jgi:hypothetical protein
MSTTNSRPPEEPGPHESWWNRIGTLGQVLTALIGLIAALVPILVKTGLPSESGTTPPQQPVHVITTTPHVPPKSSPATPTERPDPINLTVSDQLTDGAEEEIIVVTLGGSEVARLHATRERPVVSKRVRASRPGNYTYTVYAQIRWYDQAGDEQLTKATGSGRIAIDDGTRLDVYLEEADDGEVSLALRSATTQ